VSGGAITSADCTDRGWGRSPRERGSLRKHASGIA